MTSFLKRRYFIYRVIYKVEKNNRLESIHLRAIIDNKKKKKRHRVYHDESNQILKFDKMTKHGRRG